MAGNDEDQGKRPHDRPDPGDPASPADPDNRIDLERQAADAEHKEDVAAHPLTAPDGTTTAEAAAAAGSARAAKRAKSKRRARGGMTARAAISSTGHEWDGIKEYDNPLPRWWLWTFYATIVWGIAYTVFYPAWPLLTRATQGILAENTRSEVAAEIDRVNAANAPIEERLVATPMSEVAQDPELANYAVNAGGAIFHTWCAQCHGSGAGGSRGYPNLLDNDWLWGGSIDQILTTVTHGIRSPDDDQTHYSEMPRFGPDQMLEDEQIAQVVEHVLAISGQDHDPALAEAGATVFAENCVACHLEDGTGDRMQGAPDLTDAIWLYGGDRATLLQSVHDARFGVMPSWQPRLTEAELRAVSYYVHGLGGGE